MQPFLFLITTLTKWFPEQSGEIPKEIPEKALKQLLVMDQKLMNTSLK